MIERVLLLLKLWIRLGEIHIIFLNTSCLCFIKLKTVSRGLIIDILLLVCIQSIFMNSLGQIDIFFCLICEHKKGLGLRLIMHKEWQVTCLWAIKPLWSCSLLTVMCTNVMFFWVRKLLNHRIIWVGRCCSSHRQRQLFLCALCWIFTGHSSYLSGYLKITMFIHCNAVHQLVMAGVHAHQNFLL